MLATSSRRPVASMAVLVAVLLLFGSLTFVVGLAIGGWGGDATSAPSPTLPPTDDPAGIPGPTPILERITCAEPDEAWALLCDAYARVRDVYVDPVPDEELVEGAVRGMIEHGLGDPYSGYLPPETYRQALDDLSGTFSGIGAEVGIRNLLDPGNDLDCTTISEACVMVIVAPIAGSPAEAAGLRSGDIVRAVDGESTIGTTIADQVFKVRGEAGTDVTLSLERAGEQLELTITRAVIELREVESELLDGGIGYVRLTSFTDRASTAFSGALVDLFDAGATSIVFDLRDNPGGFVHAAREIAGQFLPAGELLFTVESGDDVQHWRAPQGGLAATPAVEVVVLVNNGSASASEIVAAALQETGRATVVGSPTFGKNTVQIWSELPNGGGLRLTTDRWFTPGHDSVAGGGVVPDVAIDEARDPDAGIDPALQRAIELLGG